MAAGSAIDEFYYTIAGATGATVSGLPAGVSGTLKGSDFYISGTVSASAASGDYKWTVTTTGGSTTATKSGTITVTGGTAPAVSSSSAANTSSSSSETQVESSSDAVPESNESKNETQGTTIAVSTAPQFQLVTAGRTLNVLGAAGKTVTVMDMQGRLLYGKFIQTHNFDIVLPRAGMYIVRVGHQSRKVNVK